MLWVSLKMPAMGPTSLCAGKPCLAGFTHPRLPYGPLGHLILPVKGAPGSALRPGLGQSGGTWELMGTVAAFILSGGVTVFLAPSCRESREWP